MRRKALVVFSVVIQIAFLNGCASRSPIVYQSAPLTSAEREEIQTKIFEADFNIAFPSVIAVLQDDALDLREIGKETGVIQALTRKRLDTIGPTEDWRRNHKFKRKKAKPDKEMEEGSIINQWTRWEKLTAHIEPWGSGKSRIRISIVRFGTLPAVTYSYPVRSLFTRKNITVNAQAAEEQVMVEDPVAYRKLFTKIEKAITERKQTLSK